MYLARKYSVFLMGYHDFCGLDVAIYILSLMIKNIITVIIQFGALLQYNGVKMSLYDHQTNDVLLAENMEFLVVFALMIGVHQIIIGIL